MCQIEWNKKRPEQCQIAFMRSFLCISLLTVYNYIVFGFLATAESLNQPFSTNCQTILACYRTISLSILEVFWASTVLLWAVIRDENCFSFAETTDDQTNRKILCNLENHTDAILANDSMQSDRRVDHPLYRSCKHFFCRRCFSGLHGWSSSRRLLEGDARLQKIQ